jgi:hypothetical protein
MVTIAGDVSTPVFRSAGEKSRHPLLGTLHRVGVRRLECAQAHSSQLRLTLVTRTSSPVIVTDFGLKP